MIRTTTVRAKKGEMGDGMTEPREPEVTVVVPAWNEETHIRTCLESVLGQSHSDLEVIVIDGASTDRTRDIVAEIGDRDPRVRLVENPDKIIPRGLNQAVRAARGRYLVRVDAHSSVNRDYVAVLVDHLRTGRWGGVGGRKDGTGHTAAGRAIAAAMGSRFGVGNSTYHHGTTPQEVEHIPFGAYPLEVIRDLGGWDERLRVNQDFEFDYRVRQSGRKLLFDPAARIAWLSRQTIRSFFRQYFRYGVGKTVVLRLHPESMNPRHAAPPLLVAAFGLALLLLPLAPFVSAGLVMPYLLALAGASVLTARRVRGVKAKLFVPIAFLAMHFGWGIGFFRGLARPTKAEPESIPVPESRQVAG